MEKKGDLIKIIREVTPLRIKREKNKSLAREIKRKEFVEMDFVFAQTEKKSVHI